MAAALLSPAASLAQTTPAPAAPPSEPGAAPSPPVAVAPQSRPARAWREGIMALPFVGINSVQGDAGRDTGVGFRVGALVGSRMAENFSLNFQVTYDLMNAHAASGSTPGTNVSEYMIDAGLAPLVHIPLPQYSLEIVAGPILGAFYESGSASLGTFSLGNWSWGWSVGANAGAFYRMGPNVRLGALLAFTSRIPERACISPPGQDSMCMTTGLTSAKVLGFGVAALF